MSNPLEPGEPLTELEEDGWFILWNGTPDGWLRCRPPLQLDYWR